MSLEAAAAQLQALEKHNGQLRKKDDSDRRASGQEDVAYHQWATFKVDDELFGIDVMQVKEVLRFSEITPVPGAEHFILGIINLRGNVVTVIDTRRLFGLPDTDVSDETRVIVVEFNDQEVIGLVVDSVDEVINLPQNEVERAPNVSGDETSRRFVQGVCYHNDLLIILLDLSKMLLSITPDSNEDAAY
ncbi:chemotaxis protein CheW [Marinobacterium nitratireducens]|uniref:Chemotaxis protein CheW n=1 Tax=Marinobacterium nitratireducens TaxID=518897 RepID=A0A918DPY3_9GAMM|nr:chemotaxis protein CheW [Marinobacterium nitratireducens]GGO77117.1 chemotaxis protein CheW [Marinobacterium nitratireducens]